MAKAPLIAIYKGVQIRYNVHNGRLFFEFEEQERNVQYLFEAEHIIDEPRWEDCDLKGLYLDNSFMEPYIGKAIASRRDLKTGRPDWMYKGRYDINYKKPDSWREDTRKVYAITEESIEVYKKWENDRALMNEATNVATKSAKELTKLEEVK